MVLLSLNCSAYLGTAYAESALRIWLDECFEISWAAMSRSCRCDETRWILGILRACCVDNGIGVEGARALGAAVSASSTLTSLDVSSKWACAASSKVYLVCPA